MSRSTFPVIELHPPPASGAWGVAVSGGADSVGLLLLMARRPDLSLHVVHLDHQLRGQASTEDAKYVLELAQSLALPCTIGRREQLEKFLHNPPANASARWRAMRMQFFAQVVEDENLQGMALAHHADDQAETIFMRLLRGKGPAIPGGLGGMAHISRQRGLLIIRPLLHIRRQALRDFLVSIGQSWREDASNQSDLYLRNRIRRFLGRQPQLHELILDLGRSCAAYARWIRENAPRLDDAFYCRALERVPRVLGRQSARRWLLSHGAPSESLDPATTDRLLEMALDAASPSRRQFAGNLLVRRREGRIECQPSRAG
jgi:tRNA(Ile)-lysidine synthase